MEKEDGPDLLLSGKEGLLVHDGKLPEREVNSTTAGTGAFLSLYSSIFYLGRYNRTKGLTA